MARTEKSPLKFNPSLNQARLSRSGPTIFHHKVEP